MSHCSQNIGGCSFLGPSSCSQNIKKDCRSDVLDNPLYRLPAASSGLGNLNHSTERTGGASRGGKCFLQVSAFLQQLLWLPLPGSYVSLQSKPL